MTARSIYDIFENHIFPGFPFRNRDWLAVAFERNSHDNARMPEWFFRCASKHFNRDGQEKLLIKGDCFALDGRPKEVVEVAFNWDDYHNFMLLPEGFSLEYKMVSEDGACGCWADAELTVFGGAADEMTGLFDDLGGRNSMLASIEREFFLDEPTGNEDMRAYFRGLLFPDCRIENEDAR